MRRRDSFQVKAIGVQEPRRKKEAASQASQSRRRPAKPLDSAAHLWLCINQRLHTLQYPDPGAVRLSHFGRPTPVDLSAPSITAATVFRAFCPIADDAIPSRPLLVLGERRRPSSIHCGPQHPLFAVPSFHALRPLSTNIPPAQHRDFFWSASGLLSAEPAAFVRLRQNPARFRAARRNWPSRVLSPCRLHPSLVRSQRREPPHAPFWPPTCLLHHIQVAAGSVVRWQLHPPLRAADSRSQPHLARARDMLQS